MTFDEVCKVIKKGDIISLRKELSNGLSPNLCNQYLWTLLMDAALQGNTSIGALLIESGADLDSRNIHKDTALSLAANCGHLSFIKLLLRSGASLDCYPFGDSFDSWLNWVAKYTHCSSEQAEHIRELVEVERKLRNSVDGTADSSLELRSSSE